MFLVWQIAYLHSNMKLKLTHGLCPDCLAEQKKALEERTDRFLPLEKR
jgi:hypothetical protein